MHPAHTAPTLQPNVCSVVPGHQGRGDWDKDSNWGRDSNRKGLLSGSRGSSLPPFWSCSELRSNGSRQWDAPCPQEQRGRIGGDSCAPQHNGSYMEKGEKYLQPPPPPWVPIRARGAQHAAPWLLAPEHGHRAEQEVPKSSSTIVH